MMKSNCMELYKLPAYKSLRISLPSASQLNLAQLSDEVQCVLSNFQNESSVADFLANLTALIKENDISIVTEMMRIEVVGALFKALDDLMDPNLIIKCLYIISQVGETLTKEVDPKYVETLEDLMLDIDDNYTSIDIAFATSLIFALSVFIHFDHAPPLREQFCTKLLSASQVDHQLYLAISDFSVSLSQRKALLPHELDFLSSLFLASNEESTYILSLAFANQVKLHPSYMAQDRFASAFIKLFEYGEKVKSEAEDSRQILIDCAVMFDERSLSIIFDVSEAVLYIIQSILSEDAQRKESSLNLLYRLFQLLPNEAAESFLRVQDEEGFFIIPTVISIASEGEFSTRNSASLLLSILLVKYPILFFGKMTSMGDEEPEKSERELLYSVICDIMEVGDSTICVNTLFGLENLAIFAEEREMLQLLKESLKTYSVLTKISALIGSQSKTVSEQAETTWKKLVGDEEK